MRNAGNISFQLYPKNISAFLRSRASCACPSGIVKGFQKYQWIPSSTSAHR